MCGISAILSWSGRKVPTHDTIQRMNDSLVHRGPDGQGIKLFADCGTVVGLGHRRLSIIDLAGGGQPMPNEDDTVWIAYNGEIYNHLELRRELEALGHRYRTRSDTETIIHAFEQWGPQCVDRLRGMFAFVIWDRKEQQLFAARDRIGIKPFYYLEQDDTLLCASEIKALLASGWYSPQLNREVVPEFMTFGYLAGEETLLSGVKKLLPGHWMIWRNGKLTVKQYWDVPSRHESAVSSSEGEWSSRFLSLFRETVQKHLMSDVPLGVFLSGGLDSSAIAATMAEYVPGRLMTFSVGFESKYYNEFDFAREVAAAIGAEHHEILLRADECFLSLPRLIWHEDEPIRNASSIALHQVSRLASNHVKVVLTGEGADELFAGYDRYWATLFNLRWGTLYNRLVPAWLRERCIRDHLSKWPLPLSVKKKISHTFLNHAMRPEEIVFDNFYAIFPRRIHRQLFSEEFWKLVGDKDPYDATMQLYRSRSGDMLDRLLYTDQKTYLVELLMKQDSMSMAASIESRVPFLDHHIVEFASQVPPQFKLSGSRGKHIVKRAMQQMLPKSILTRKKMGFPVPLNRWFREGFTGVVEKVLLGETAKARGLFNEAFVGMLVREHQQGVSDHTDALWTVLNFELWARMFLDGQDQQAVAEELGKNVGLAKTTRAVAVA